MTEVDPEEHDASENLLSGLESGDLTSGVYEGGFKTWECALDLASLCAGLDFDAGGVSGWDIVELGAGSAIPSLAILRKHLSSRAKAVLRMTLCDYNEDVLRLATAPNVLVNYFQQAGVVSSSSTSTLDELSDEGEFDVEALGSDCFDNLETSLLQRGVFFNFLSGGWGDLFIDLFASLPPSSHSSPTQQPRNLLILASETIYSLASTKIFANALLRLIRRHQQLYEGGDAKAWVAAKKVYFGVGGGVDDFMHEIERLNGEVHVLYETSDTGVGRVILQVTVPT
jgi:protein-histidine N-methyltransferase